MRTKQKAHTASSLQLLSVNPTHVQLAAFAHQVCHPERSGETMEACVMRFLTLRYGKAKAKGYIKTPEFRSLLNARIRARG